jgi:flagellar basal-body rod protein FlgB
MTEGLESITTAALGLALDAAALRQQALASNIANAGTLGYVPLRVNFEAQLEEARSALRVRGLLDASSLAEVRPVLERVSHGELGMPAKAMLDQEVASMSQNAVHYQALVRGLSRHYAILSAAVSDGKK